MKPACNVATLIERFFTERLMRQRNVSANTIASYRDTFRLLFMFAQVQLRKPPSALTLTDLDTTFIGAFLTDLEVKRGASAKTRNQADRYEEGKGCHRPKDRSHPSLHLGRWHILRLGAAAARLIFARKFLVRSAGLAMSRWDGVEVTSFIRLVAVRPYSAANVEAPNPDIIVRRCATSERTMTPAKASTSPGDPMLGRQSTYQPRSRRLRNPDQRRRRERYRRAVGTFKR
ncbi:hypothetical protein ABIA45_000026 [Bradyrhizobium sp. USDA 336]